MAGSAPARRGTSVGTVVRWDDDRREGVVEFPDLPGGCAVAAGALDPASGGRLRAGQVVEVEWTATGEGAVRAERVVPRDDLQATPGG